MVVRITSEATQAHNNNSSTSRWRRLNLNAEATVDQAATVASANR